MKTLSVRTSRRDEMIDITEQVARAIGDSASGAALVFVTHTTAGLTINENADPDVTADMLDVLRRLAPRDAGYRHGEGNSDAHVKATLVGSSVVVPVDGGRMALGTWQGIYFCEFDGPRSRKVHVQMLAAL